MFSTTREARLYKGIAHRVTRMRHEAEQTQREAAKACGVSRGAYTNLEAGRFRIQVHTLYKLAAHFKVSVAELLP